MNPTDRIIGLLREHGCNPKRNGKVWHAKCLAHDDENPSLSIAEGDDGRVLLHCHAGCTVDEICSALSISKADLFAYRVNGYTQGMADVSPSPKPPKNRTPRSFGDGRVFATAREAVAELEHQHGPRSALWTYTNASGDPVGLVVRWDTPAGKEIRPVSRAADETHWIIGGMPTPRLLYALPELLASKAGDRVYVTEGEKVADAARAMGLTATTSPHGSKSASKADWTPMACREVVILPDHDKAGEQFADEVARLAMAAGAQSVRIVRLVELWSGIPKGGDLVDLIQHCGGDVNAVRTEVEALANAANVEAVTDEVPMIPTYTPFPVDVLPEPVRSFIAGGAKAIGCDPSYIALPLLSALAAAIGTTHRIELKRGWTEPAIIWTAIVGESGTMKTPAFKLAMRALRKVQDKAWKEHQAEHAEHDTECLRYDAQLTAWKRQAAKGKGDADDPPEKPEQPIAQRFIVSDTTCEALAPILLGNPRGVLLSRDELNGWIGSFDRYAKAGRAGADSANWLSIHNGESMTIDRKTGNPPTIHVPSASVSICGGIQPGILARAMSVEHHDSGLLGRLLFAMPTRTVKRWTENEVDAMVEAAICTLFDRLLALTADMDDDGDDRPRLVTLTPDGKAAWIAFCNEHGIEHSELTGDLAAAWSKLEGYAARLALVIHLTRWAGGDPIDPLRIDEASIAAGVVLVRWFGDEAKRVYAILSETDKEREQRALAEWVEHKHGGVVTVRDLTHGLRKYRGDPNSAERDLSALAEAGIGRWEVDDHNGNGGRPARRFRLLSGVPVTRTPANIGKDGSCGDGDTLNRPDYEWGKL